MVAAIIKKCALLYIALSHIRVFGDLNAIYRLDRGDQPLVMAPCRSKRSRLMEDLRPCGCIWRRLMESLYL